MALSEVMKFKRLQYGIGDLIDGPTGSDRVKVFNELIAYYNTKLKSANGKVIYAFLTPDEYESTATQFDFCIIMKVTNDLNRDIYLVECPMRYSDKCLASYVKCKENGTLDDYYYETMKLTCRVSKGRYMEFIQVMAELSTEPKNELYWKAPNNAFKLLDKVSDLAMRYTPSMSQK